MIKKISERILLKISGESLMGNEKFGIELSIVDKLANLTDKEINEQIRIIKQANKNLEEISKTAQLPIFYYEDLFSKDNKGLKYLFKYLDVKYKDSYKNDSFYKLNPKFRYRVFEQTSTTLDNKKKSTF